MTYPKKSYGDCAPCVSASDGDHGRDTSRMRAEWAAELRAALVTKITDAIDQTGEMFSLHLTQQGSMIHTWMHEQGFWNSDNKAEKFALMHSEISEALEAMRKDLPSDKIPGYTGEEEELADLLIRVLDYSHHFQLRLGEAIAAKMKMNLSREKMHGKKC